MTTRATYYIMCDLCGETDGHSYTEEVARKEIRAHGWVRVRDGRGKIVDMCWRCAEREAAKEEGKVQP